MRDREKHGHFHFGHHEWVFLDGTVLERRIWAWVCGPAVALPGRNGVSIVELPGGDADHQVAGLVVGQGQSAAVEGVERDDRGEREPLPDQLAGFGYWFICSDTAQSRSAASGSSA